MNIDLDTLLVQVDRARALWPFIEAVETMHQLPPGLLLAVGSRETNLTNEVGDGGHGHGVWQLDNRSHVIPAGFDADVHQQCTTAAAMLAALIAQAGPNLALAVAAYNTGWNNATAGLRDQGSPDAYTAGADYSRDVLDRRAAILAHRQLVTPTPHRKARKMLLIDDAGTPAIYLQTADGHLHLLHSTDDVRAYQSAGVPQITLTHDQVERFLTNQ